MIKKTTAEEELKEFMIKLGRQKGGNLLISTVIAEMFVNPEETTLEELSRRTGYSLASVSTAVNQLEKMGKIRKHKKLGSKKIYFSMEKDIVKSTLEMMTSMKEIILTPLKEKLPEIISRMKKENNPEKKKKIIWYKEYLEQLEKIIRVMNKMEEELRREELIEKNKQ